MRLSSLVLALGAALALAPAQAEEVASSPWRLWPSLGLLAGPTSGAARDVGPELGLALTAGGPFLGARLALGSGFTRRGTAEVHVWRVRHRAILLGEAAFAVDPAIALVAALGGGAAYDVVDLVGPGDGDRGRAALLAAGAWSLGAEARFGALSFRFLIEGLVLASGHDLGVTVALGLPL